MGSPLAPAGGGRGGHVLELSVPYFGVLALSRLAHLFRCASPTYYKEWDHPPVAVCYTHEFWCDNPTRIGGQACMHSKINGNYLTKKSAQKVVFKRTPNTEYNSNNLSVLLSQ